MKVISIAVLLIVAVLLPVSWAAGYHSRGYQYIFPTPESQQVSCYANIIIRFNSITPHDLENPAQFMTVTGGSGAVYKGILTIASDHKTIIFKPLTPFKAGETVIVRLSPNCRDAGKSHVSSFEFQFTVSPAESIPSMIDQKDESEQEFSAGRSSSPGMFESRREAERVDIENVFIPESAFSRQNGKTFLGAVENSATRTAVRKTVGQAMTLANKVSVPGDFPYVVITANDNPDTGLIFLDNWNGVPYNLILDNTGWPVWYMRTPDQRRDFKVQGNGLLTMMVRQGFPNVFGWGYIGLDHNYAVVDSFCAVNGYGSDEHDLQVLPDGHYLLIGIRFVNNVDMSQIFDGGNKNATIRESCIQEFTPEHEMIFQWSALDHYDLHDVQLEDVRGSEIRFSHMNSISIDDDGNIILSNRHLSEVTKINRQTGEIIWRLGGAHNQFTFVNDELDGFRNQHDARALGNGHYTVFDNGNMHNPPVSRAAEFQVDTTAMTATLVWQFRDNPDKYSNWMGNVQRLPNGNTLINWADGSLPKLTEVRPNGEKAFEMWFKDYMHCYRVFRCLWEGMSTVPYLIAEAHN
jgi:hypothetical protein